MYLVGYQVNGVIHYGRNFSAVLDARYYTRNNLDGLWLWKVKGSTAGENGQPQYVCEPVRCLDSETAYVQHDVQVALDLLTNFQHKTPDEARCDALITARLSQHSHLSLANLREMFIAGRIAYVAVKKWATTPAALDLATARMYPASLVNGKWYTGDYVCGPCKEMDFACVDGKGETCIWKITPYTIEDVKPALPKGYIITRKGDELFASLDVAEIPFGAYVPADICEQAQAGCLTICLPMQPHVEINVVVDKDADPELFMQLLKVYGL